MARFCSKAYLQQFPEVIPIDKTPPVWQSLVPGPSKQLFRTPTYSAGWTLTVKEIYLKYQPRNTILNAAGRLYEIWEELNFDKKYANHPVIQPPRLDQLNRHDYLFIFVQNGLETDMKEFQKHRELVFNVMCELFGIDDEESKEIIRGRFNWYRGFVDEYRITGKRLFVRKKEEGGGSNEDDSGEDSDDSVLFI